MARFRVNIWDMARLFVEDGGHMQIVTNRVPFDFQAFYGALGMDVPTGESCPAGRFAFLTDLAVNDTLLLDDDGKPLGRITGEQRAAYWRALWAGLNAGASVVGRQVFDIVAQYPTSETWQTWGVAPPPGWGDQVEAGREAPINTQEV